MRKGIAAAPPLRAAVPWRFLTALWTARLGVYLLASGPLAYGYLSDEFYYLECARRLAWGYVDHPPLSIALLRLVRATLGDSLLALRLLPTLAHCGAVALVALLARELGGGRAAQRLAALAALVSPLYLGVTDFYSMNAFEPALWAAAALLLARIANGADPRTWLLLGLVLGLGLLNKISMLWLGVGLAVGLAATPERRWLATPWPWLAALLAFALFSPYLLWQAQHGWPLFEFMENARTQKMVVKPPATFVAEQLLVMNPVVVPLWAAGLVHYFASGEGRRQQLLGWIWIGAFALLMASGAVRANYLGPAYTVLLPAGGVAFERLARRRHWRWLPAGAASLFLVGGAALAPMAISLLPPERFAAYQRTIGVTAPVDQKEDLGPMPLHFGLRFGWAEIRAGVAKAVASLSPEERERAVVLGGWFGDTGMVNFYGTRDGFPPAIGGHNNYWLWGPGEATGEVVIAVAETDDDLRRWFEDVREVAEVDCLYCLPDVARLRVFVCRQPRLPISDWWPEVKNYI
jgi:4-amino-4-deoxy-L-arabinose transferase-like glycosyltransferase